MRNSSTGETLWPYTCKERPDLVWFKSSSSVCIQLPLRFWKNSCWMTSSRTNKVALDYVNTSTTSFSSRVLMQSHSIHSCVWQVRIRRRGSLVPNLTTDKNPERVFCVALLKLELDEMKMRQTFTRVACSCVKSCIRLVNYLTAACHALGCWTRKCCDPRSLFCVPSAKCLPRYSHVLWTEFNFLSRL